MLGDSCGAPRLSDELLHLVESKDLSIRFCGPMLAFSSAAPPEELGLPGSSCQDKFRHYAAL
ncbi:hypothetical protein E2C01_048397 [Portunus trituberculatus]|uniref:Uncharacterized protein n=1 Tax=Portunus trituberculatus TaxID=210409 RepID=A0A5B7GA49_PORTR|nr:hypothetical protein [Portunus trituberculatus]